MHDLVCTVVWTFVLISHTVSGQGGPCTGAPNMCFPTGHMAATTCITPADIGSGLSWYEMGNLCKQNDGRLVWLHDELDLDHLLSTSFRSAHGSFVVTGLLSSTTDNAGLFWRNINDTSFTCGTSDTAPCLSPYSTPDSCFAVGCCWRNGKCQYPHVQNLPTFRVNETSSNISRSTHRQCVGFQVNANSSNAGRWVSYDCFTPVDDALYVCEYKCNVADWPNTNLTTFLFQDPTTQTTMQMSTSAVNATTETTTSVTNAPTTPGCSTTPNVHTTPGPNNSNQGSTIGASKDNALKQNNHSFLKLLLSLETDGATNMSFSLQQDLP